MELGFFRLSDVLIDLQLQERPAGRMHADEAQTRDTKRNDKAFERPLDCREIAVKQASQQIPSRTKLLHIKLLSN
eukprot:2718425-Amphidinium_carterae.1